MKRFYRAISVVVAVCFVFNTIAADLVLAQTVNFTPKSDNLSTPSACNDIAGIQNSDMMRIQLAVQTHLMALSKSGPLTEHAIRNALSDPHVNILTFFDFDKLQIFYREMTVTPEGPSVMCRIKDGHGLRTYHALFSFEKDPSGGFPVKVLTDGEFKKASQLRNDNGTFKAHPGKSMKDALKLIAASDELMAKTISGDGFILADYLVAYNAKAAELGFEALAENPQTTARRDLEALAERGILTVTTEARSANVYRLNGAIGEAMIGAAGVALEHKEDRMLESMMEEQARGRIVYLYSKYSTNEPWAIAAIGDALRGKDWFSLAQAIEVTSIKQDSRGRSRMRIAIDVISAHLALEYEIFGEEEYLAFANVIFDYVANEGKPEKTLSAQAIVGSTKKAEAILYNAPRLFVKNINISPKDSDRLKEYMEHYQTDPNPPQDRTFDRLDWVGTRNPDGTFMQHPGKSPNDLLMLISIYLEPGETITSSGVLELYKEHYQQYGFEEPAKDRDSAMRTIRRDLFESDRSLLKQGAIEELATKGANGERHFKLTQKGRDLAHSVLSVPVIERSDLPGIKIYQHVAGGKFDYSGLAGAAGDYMAKLRKLLSDNKAKGLFVAYLSPQDVMAYLDGCRSDVYMRMRGDTLELKSRFVLGNAMKCLSYAEGGRYWYWGGTRWHTWEVLSLVVEDGLYSTDPAVRKEAREALLMRDMPEYYKTGVANILLKYYLPEHPRQREAITAAISAATEDIGVVDVNTDGTITRRAGKGQDDVFMTIALSPELQKGPFTMQECLKAYEELRLKHPELGLGELNGEPEAFIRRSLGLLIAKQRLTMRRQGKYNIYELTSTGKGLVNIMMNKGSETRNIDAKIAETIGKIHQDLKPALNVSPKTTDTSVKSGAINVTLSDGTKMTFDQVAVDKVLGGLPKVLKEYDVRGLDNVFTPEMLVLLGISLGTSRFNSHHGTEGLKAGDLFLLAGDNGPTTPKMRKYIAEGLRLTGVNVADLGLTVGGELYNAVFRLGAQGGAYVTRSHVEVGTNGFKPLVGNTTLYADMIQELGETIKKGEFRIASEGNEGKIITADSDTGKKVHDLSKEVYRLNLIKEFSHIQQVMKDTGMKVGIDFGGGSATQYVPLAKELLGDRLVNIYGQDQDPTCKNGLPDPSRADCVKDVVDLSQKDPSVIWFSYDLDTDRMAIIWNGRLFKGDLLFYPVVENVLRNGDGLQREFLYDARMSPAIAELVENMTGVAKIHPKGHSKVKRTVELIMKGLAKSQGYKSVREFVQATGHHDFQMEYSLHPFVTTETGACIDDAFRFTFWWIEAFSAMRKRYGNDITLDSYLKELERTGAVSKWYSLSEQRTDMQEDFKKSLMNKMRDRMLEAFKGRDDFDFVKWEDFKRAEKPFTLVDTEGVYYFMTPLGIFYWGWSNTSAKIAFGAHSKNEENLKDLTTAMLSIMFRLRDGMPEATGVAMKDASKHIGDLETTGLLLLFGVIDKAQAEKIQGDKKPSQEFNIELERSVLAKFGSVEEAIRALQASVPGKAATALSGSDEIADAVRIAGEAGLQIPTHPKERCQLLVTSDFFANGELEAHRLKYGDRFELNTVSGAHSVQFVENVLTKAKGKEERTIALVPDSLPFGELARLKMAGVRFIRINTADLADAKAQKDPEREKFQLDTYAMMLLVRSIKADIKKDSSIYRVLSFYIKSHFVFDGSIAVDDYINAIVKSDVAALIKGYLAYKPAEAYRVPEYNTIAAALISA